MCIIVLFDKIPPIKLADIDAISMFNSIVEVKSMVSVLNAEINALKNNSAVSAEASRSSLMTKMNTENEDETELKRVNCSTGGSNDNVQDYNCETQVKKLCFASDNPFDVLQEETAYNTPSEDRNLEKHTFREAITSTYGPFGNVSGMHRMKNKPSQGEAVNNRLDHSFSAAATNIQHRAAVANVSNR